MLVYRLLVVTMVMVVVWCEGGEEQHQHRHQHHHQQQEEQGRKERGVTEEQQGTTPVRHEVEGAPGEGGVSVGGEIEGGECPPSQPFSSDLCSAPACLHHHRCTGDTACCFNGCIHTCLSLIEAPAVIDWLEDTSSLLPILDPDESSPSELPVRYEDVLSYAEGREEMVHLPGGCTISGKQYSQLQEFMKAPSIEDCMCQLGEVVCAVKMKTQQA